MANLKAGFFGPAASWADESCLGADSKGTVGLEDSMIKVSQFLFASNDKVEEDVLTISSVLIKLLQSQNKKEVYTVS